MEFHLTWRLRRVNRPVPLLRQPCRMDCTRRDGHSRRYRRRVPTLCLNARRKSFHALANFTFCIWNHPRRTLVVQCLLNHISDRIIARIYAFLLGRRFCALCLCRVYSVLCALALWTESPPIPQRVYRLKGQWLGRSQSLFSPDGPRKLVVARRVSFVIAARRN